MAGLGRIGSRDGDLFGQTDFDDMAGFAAFDQAENAVVDEATHGRPDRAVAKASAAGEPLHGKLELEPAFEASVAEEIEIDDLVDGGEAQPRDEDVGELFPDEYDIGDFGFHVWAPKRVEELKVEEFRSRELTANSSQRTAKKKTKTKQRTPRNGPQRTQREKLTETKAPARSRGAVIPEKGYTATMIRLSSAKPVVAEAAPTPKIRQSHLGVLA